MQRRVIFEFFANFFLNFTYLEPASTHTLYLRCPLTDFGFLLHSKSLCDGALQRRVIFGFLGKIVKMRKFEIF